MPFHHSPITLFYFTFPTQVFFSLCCIFSFAFFLKKKSGMQLKDKQNAKK